MLEVDTITCPPLQLVGMRHVGPYNGIAGVFGRLAAWANGAGLVTPQTRFIGIYYDNPREVDADQLRSDACITVDRPLPDGPLADGVTEIDVPGGRHAVIRHLGPYPELSKTYDWIFGTWLPDSGETPAGVAYEDYLNNANEIAPEDLITDIYVPLAERETAQRASKPKTA